MRKRSIDFGHNLIYFLTPMLNIPRKNGEFHGLSRDNHKQRIYRIYDGMKHRCHNSKNPNYRFYGAKGIEVCQEWLESVETFYTWAITHGYQEDLSIDRIDPKLGYFPDNCRWITISENSSRALRRGRPPKMVTINGVTHTIAHWAKIKGMDYRVVRTRIYVLGWTHEDAITIPIGKTFEHSKVLQKTFYEFHKSLKASTLSIDEVDAMLKCLSGLVRTHPKLVLPFLQEKSKKLGC